MNPCCSRAMISPRPTSPRRCLPMHVEESDTLPGSSGDDDLPDLIGVVMEMGQPSAERENIPSPSLPVSTRDAERLPGHLEALAERARGYVEAASSANTRREIGRASCRERV